MVDKDVTIQDPDMEIPLQGVTLHGTKEKAWFGKEIELAGKAVHHSLVDGSQHIAPCRDLGWIEGRVDVDKFVAFRRLGCLPFLRLIIWRKK